MKFNNGETFHACLTLAAASYSEVFRLSSKARRILLTGCLRAVMTWKPSRFTTPIKYCIKHCKKNSSNLGSADLPVVAQ